MIRLFDFLLPQENVCMERELYYRANGQSNAAASREEGALLLPEGSSVSFDTYFNCFPYSQYLRNTWVKSVGIFLKAEGVFLVRLYALFPSGGREARKLLWERKAEIRSGQPAAFSQTLEGLPEGGVFYVELTARSSGAVFYGGFYGADAGGRENPVKVAAVVCTYRREPFVYRNMQNVSQAIYHSEESPIRDDIDFLIVDNGHTVESSRVENEHIQVFRNKNWGGSGGFTRGILEACREAGKYTHVLLMDDDILFETDVLVRTVGFLKVLRPEYLEFSVAAGMLERDRPYLQYGTGGVWKGRCGALLKSGLDLRSPVSILQNVREERADYSSWWYTCIPLSIVRKRELPFPFFIKADDEEYGVRTGGNFIFLSGADVWHDSFRTKYNARLEYYIKRNEMILNALHFPGYGLWHNLGKLFLALGKQALAYHYAGVDYLFAAYRDFLEGADFFLRTDAEELNSRLAELGQVKRTIPFLHLAAGFFRTAAKMISGYQNAAESYRNRLGELTSFDFWCGRLAIGPAAARASGGTIKNGSVKSR